MPKPDYKKANERLMKFLESEPEPEPEPEPKVTSSKNRIIDVTEESLGTVYQFTENDLLVIKDTSKGDKDEK